MLAITVLHHYYNTRPIFLLSFHLVHVNKDGDPTCSTHVYQQQECVTKLQLKVVVLELSLLRLL